MIQATNTFELISAVKAKIKNTDPAAVGAFIREHGVELRNHNGVILGTFKDGLEANREKNHYEHQTGNKCHFIINEDQ